MRTIVGFCLLLVPAMAFAQAAPPAAAPDSGTSRWPMVADSPVGQITIYKPQLEDFQGEQITGRAAVSVIRPGQTDPIFGAIWITSRVSIDEVERTAMVIDVQITKARFPDLQPADQQALTDAIRQRMLQDPPVISLSHLLASLEVVKKEQAAGDELQTAPPKIVYVERPAVKVQFDGKPRFVQQGDDGMVLTAINTPFLVALNLSDKQYYLYGAGQWFTAADVMGPWTVANGVPKEVADLATAPTTAPNPDEAAAEQLTPQQLAAVQIVVAIEPTELIWTDGPAQMSSVEGTSLLYVANTPADLFLNIDNQQYYVLLSGRWYTAPKHDGPWTFVAPEKLPADFAKIPPDSDRGSVLAQVPNTPQAQDAVMDTDIPQTAAIDRTQVQRPTVEYDGPPQFQPIEQTGMTYAVNTPFSVICVNNAYYCCWNGVWYNSNAAVGPWDVCTTVPGVIYTMPPSSPLYPCRYVMIYGYTPQFVYCGYTPGYVGCYVYHGCVVFGTGYVYQPWIGELRFYPRPYTFGFGAQYDPYTNFWGFSFGFGWGGGWMHPPPHIAGDARGWFGYGGYRPVLGRVGPVTINHTIIEKNVTVMNVEHNVYARRTDVHALAGPRPAPAANAPAHTDVNRPDSNRPVVMSDAQGNVYRHDADGWQRRQGNTWVSAGDAGVTGGKYDTGYVSADPHQAPADHADAHPPQPPPNPPADTGHADSGHAAKNNDGGGNSDSGDMKQLNQDYQARLAGEQRDQAREKQQQQQNSNAGNGGGGGSGAGGGNRNGNNNQNGNGNPNNNNGNNGNTGGNGNGGGGGGRNH